LRIASLVSQSAACGRARTSITLARRRQTAGTEDIVRILKIAACGLPLILAEGARADDFYAGKTVTMVVGYGVNNGYDSYARAVGRHIQKHLPGHPSIVVQNMPGAGSLAAISYLYNSAARDGTVIGMIDQAAPLAQVMGDPGLRADVRKFNWIGRMITNAAILFSWSGAKVQSMRDTFDTEMIVATPGQSSRIISTLLKNMLGLKLRILTGYPNSAEALLAMERREIDAAFLPWPVLQTERPEWLAQKKVRLLSQMGTESNQGLNEVPLVVDLARNDEERKILELMTRDSAIGRSLMSPPGEPPARVAELRAAFSATMTDPEYLDDMRKLGLDLKPMNGADLQAVVDKTGDVDPAMVAKAKAFSAVDK
jgi:tripartite-type tricarboxylate transporter receptor subunit TctC